MSVPGQPTETQRQALETLGLDVDATAADIKRAFTRLSRAAHPDLHPGRTDAAAEFRRVVAARDALAGYGEAGAARGYGATNVPRGFGLPPTTSGHSVRITPPTPSPSSPPPPPGPRALRREANRIPRLVTIGAVVIVTFMVVNILMQHRSDRRPEPPAVSTGVATTTVTTEPTIQVMIIDSVDPLTVVDARGDRHPVEYSGSVDPSLIGQEIAVQVGPNGALFLTAPPATQTPFGDGSFGV